MVYFFAPVMGLEERMSGVNRLERLCCNVTNLASPQGWRPFVCPFAALRASAQGDIKNL
jgi:hypothetical protein